MLKVLMPEQEWATYFRTRMRTTFIRYAPYHVKFVDTFKEADILFLHSMYDVPSMNYGIQRCIFYEADVHNFPQHEVDKRSLNKADIIVAYRQEVVHAFQSCGFNAIFMQYPVDYSVFHEQSDWELERDYLLLCPSANEYEFFPELVQVLKALNQRGIVFSMQPVRHPLLEIIHQPPFKMDTLLVRAYHRVKFVSGLHTGFGFEYPVVEGLACGAIPILFDFEYRKKAFGKAAVYIRYDPATIVEELIERLSSPVEIDTETRKQVLAQFDASRVVPQFFAELENLLEKD